MHRWSIVLGQFSWSTFLISFGNDSPAFAGKDFLQELKGNVPAMAIRTLAPFELMLSSISVGGVSALKRTFIDWYAR
jgi:hypothetical protein